MPPFLGVVVNLTGQKVELNVYGQCDIATFYVIPDVDICWKVENNGLK